MSEESSRNVLMVEGPDDCHVVKYLRSETSLDFSIVPMGGVEKALKFHEIETRFKATECRALGIMVDADDNLDARWNKVSSRLVRLGISVPDAPEPNGTIIPARNDDEPRVGIWLMPDNRSNGELEDFIKSMIPENDPVWPLSEEYINGIPPEHRKFPSGKILRAQVHAWLAARKRPRPGMGSAIAAKDLDIKALSSRTFLAWLQKLFPTA